MDPITLLVGAVLAYLIFSRAGTSIPGTGYAPPITTPAQPTQTFAQLNQGYGQEQQMANTAINTSVAATTAIAGKLGALQNDDGTASALGTAIPIVGAAFTAIAGALLAASKARAQAAVNENQAVDAALPAWDNAIRQVAQLFNNGSITLQQVGQLLGTPRTNKYFGVPVGQCWSNYWSEVGPQVQSGRNGCQSGTVSQTEGVSFCGGSYGAGCCIAYDDMDNSMGNPNLPQDCFFAALKKAVANPGTPYTATILAIAPSKYSTYSRGQYQVTLEAPLH